MAYSGEHRILFEYGPMDSGSALTIELENMSVSEVSINGNRGHLYSSTIDSQVSCVIWIDIKSNTSFLIDGFISDDELIRTAQNVTLVSKK